MIVQLLNGKTVEIPSIMYFSMTDEEWELEMQDLVAHNFGYEQEDPFYLASFTINEKESTSDDELFEEDTSIDFNEYD